MNDSPLQLLGHQPRADHNGVLICDTCTVREARMVAGQLVAMIWGEGECPGQSLAVTANLEQARSEHEIASPNAAAMASILDFLAGIALIFAGDATLLNDRNAWNGIHGELSDLAADVRSIQATDPPPDWLPDIQDPS